MNTIEKYRRYVNTSSLAGIEPIVVGAASGATVTLRVQDNGPPVPPEQLGQLFEPFVTVREGQSGWKLAVCKTIARRLQANIRGENRPEGGLAIVVDLRPANGKT